ncbi:hypothetical protein Hamer_G023908 [Homarus americanus]|uniref:Uncharacterized protein n=1 Tax=Homarus americanus TaxID=6706 RepID=A0A8J5MSL3_HOMAM|nr:hypothetical protein Hamer_G023908 [Homarus americanus]
MGFRGNDRGIVAAATKAAEEFKSVPFSMPFRMPWRLMDLHL